MTALSMPNKWGLVFHHLGLAVIDPQPAITFLAGLGYQIGPTVFDPLQNVNLGMCTHEQMPNVEIVYPTAGQGPLDKLLATHKDGLVYHMCYVCNDLDKTLDAIESDGALRLFTVSAAKPAILFGGNEVSFYVVAGVGLIEIIDQRSCRDA